jgi:hypothetical protein
MRITDQYVWNVIFLVFFLVLVWISLGFLQRFGYRSVYSVTTADLLLITLATFRVIRLVVYDKIFAFFREQFFDANPVAGGEIVLTKPPYGPRRTLADLVSCPWCFGMWAAAMVTFFYFLTPYTFYLVLFLAISAVATFLQLCANFVGWRAEEAKTRAERE